MSVTEAGARAEETASASLVRGLGPIATTSLVVGNMIGSGIYVVPAGLAEVAGPLGLAAWAINTAGYLCLTCVFADLGGAYPVSGGLQAFAFTYGTSHHALIDRAQLKLALDLGQQLVLDLRGCLRRVALRRDRGIRLFRQPSANALDVLGRVLDREIDVRAVLELEPDVDVPRGDVGVDALQVLRDRER